MTVWKGLTTFVTGGAGALGSAVVRMAVKRGGNVAFMDLPDSTAEALVEKVNSTNIMFISGDVRSNEDISNAIHKAENKFGRIHNCVSCAATHIAFQIVNPVKKTSCDLDDAVNVINTNLIGTFNVTRLMAEHMSQNEPNENNQRGVIINTSGFYDEDGWKGQCVISAAGNAIRGMTLPLARDLSDLGIRVCTISPGIFESPYVENWPPEVNSFFKRLTLHPNRFGRPREYAHLVESIISNPMLNGETIKLDAGFKIPVL